MRPPQVGRPWRCAVCLAVTGLTLLVSGCTQSAPPVACAQDVLICPDGSAVGRVPPACQFAPCPGAPAASPEPALASTRTTAPMPTPPSPSPALLVHARDFFPYGVYVAGGTLWDLRNFHIRGTPFATVEEYLENMTAGMERAGFNVVWPNNLLGPTDEYEQLLRLWGDAARRHGLRLIPQGGPFPGGTEEIYRGVTDWPGLVEREIKPFYRQVVPKFKEDPTLLVWSVGEEPPADERDRPIYEAIRTVAQDIARMDPNHPAIFLYHWTEGVEMGARIVRPEIQASNIGVFMDNPGLVTWSQNTIYYTSELERRFQAARSHGAPFWAMGGTNENDEYANGMKIKDRRSQTLPEIRWQLWAGLLHGAKGYFWFVYRDVESGPIPNGEYIRGMVDWRGNPGPMYHAAAEAGREIRPLHPLLVRLEPGPLGYRVLHNAFDYDETYERYWADLPMVRWRSFAHMDSGTNYWMVVNFDLNQSQAVQPPANMTASAQLRDVRTGSTYTPTSLGGLVLPPGGGTLLEVVRN